MTDRRKAAATASTGYSLIAAGAALRGHAIDEAHTAIKAPKRVWPPVGAVYTAHQLRAPGYARIGRRFLGGTALVTVGAPAAAKGTYDLLRRRRPRPSSSLARPDEVAKRRRTLVGEGVAGTGEALQEKAESLHSGAPAQVRAVPVAVGGATAGAASLTAHRLLDLFERRGKLIHPRGRNALTAAAAVPGALASLPLSRRLTRRSGYQVTPTGVRKSFLPRMSMGGVPGGGQYIRAVDLTSRQRQGLRYALGVQHDVHQSLHSGKVRLLPGKSGKIGGTVGPQYMLERNYAHELARQVRRHVPVEGRLLHHGEAGPDFLAREVASRAAKPIRSRPVVNRATGPFMWRGLETRQRPLSKSLRRPTSYDAPDYRGRHTPVAGQRAAIYSASALPVVGPITGARTAGRYAPPGKARHTEARQIAAGPGLGTVSGVTAAYGAARATDHSRTVGDAAQSLADAGRRAKARLIPRAAGAERLTGRFAGVKTAVKEHRALESMFGNPRRATAALVGYSIAKPVAGQLGGAWAMRENQRDQRHYNARHFPIHKADTSGMSQRQREQLARRKRIQATASVVAGTAGLGALGLLVAAKHPTLAPQAAVLEHHRNSVLAVGAGVSGAANFNFAGIQRREAREDVKRPPMRALTTQAKRNQNAVVLAKSDRIHTTMHEHEARRLVRSYGGLQGPLPPGLDREEKMRAYEARYVASGGKKVHRWQRRAQGAEVVRNAGLAGGAAAGAAWLAASSTRGRAAGRAVAMHLPARARAGAPALRRGAERAAVGAATIGATAELAGEYARRRRASYTSAPGGVAASALRRMQAYTPEGNR